MGFPESFWWGTGASSDATDGAAPGSDLHAWARHGARPPLVGDAGLTARAADDIGLLAEHGLRHLRFVLDWTRLEPVPGQHDSQAIEDALRVLEVARAAGVSVWGCLHDGSLPGWFAVDEHGFTDARSRGYLWARHVEFIGETFGPHVHGWVPVYEPNRWAAQGWLDGARPPGLRDDAEGFAEALEGIQLATVGAALRLRQDGHPVASAQWLPPVFAARLQPGAPATPDAEAMASIVDEVHRGSWLRLLEEETLQVPGRGPVDVPGAREAFDLIGFTYRHAIAVRGDGALLPYPQDGAEPGGAPVAFAEGLGLVLHRLADALPDRSLLVAGVGLSTADEDQREQYVRDLLLHTEEAVDGGIDLRGWWWNTPIDPSPERGGPGLFDHDRAVRPALELLAEVVSGRPIPT